MKLKVKITPNAKRNEIIGWFGDQLKIKVTAPPEKGKANAELVKFLADSINIPLQFITIIHGSTSTSKLLEIEGICLEELNEKLDLQSVQDSLL